MTENKNEKNKIFDLIIIGGGPAGVTAAVYAARKKLHTLVLTKDWGGQSVVSDTIENWIGEIEIKGFELAKKLENHVKYYANDTDFIVKDFQEVKKVSEKEAGIFEVETLFGEKFLTKSVLVASGSKRRKLTVPGAEKFEHKGLTYCASCDGPVFTGKDVVVIGGGNSGFESASQLLAYTKSVSLLHRGEEFRAEPTMVENVLANEKMTGILNADITEVYGNDFVEGIKYKDLKTGEIKDLKVSGVFVEIGAIPATEFLEEGLVEKNKYNSIVVDHKTMRTSKEGIWAAGDCNDGIYKQNSISIGDGTKAIEDIYIYLKAKNK